MLKYLRYIIYSFPIQLFVLHIKKHPLLLVFWGILFASASNNFGKHYGVPFLLLDPEYNGSVTAISFLIVGFAMGGYIMTWNICFYMLNSYRFKFLASLSKPFGKFCINNFIVPLLFIIVYITTLIRFQSHQELSPELIALNVSGLLGGMLLMILITMLYFSLFNTDIVGFLNSLTNKTKEQLLKRNIYLEKLDHKNDDLTQWPVETYLSGLTVRLVRNVDHYDQEIIRRVLRRHHNIALVIIFVSLFTLFAFSYLIDNPIFRIPAGAGFFLILTVFMVFACLTTFWFGGWRTVFIFSLLFVVNFFSQYDYGVYKHKIMGVRYEEPLLKYNTRTVQEHVTQENIAQDVRETSNILYRWHRKMGREYGEYKPKIIFIQSAGGGMKSAYWCMNVLQSLEKDLKGKLFDHTILMSGASGGMLGAAYFRELYLRDKVNQNLDCTDPDFREDIAKDLLNPIVTAIAVNDLFFPWQGYQFNGQRLSKDRAYWFDKQFNENTHYLMDKKVMDYAQAEKKAIIPMMVISPTIVNDQRILFISAQPAGYFTRPYVKKNRGYLDYLSPDGVEFMRFFGNRGAENLPFISALRMNATYPYILPSPSMPTIPEMKILDAGIRENYGFGVSTRFLNVFKDWIEQYTSGVIFVQIRTDNKLMEHEKAEKKATFLQELITPFGNLYSNFLYEQEYSNDQYVGMLANNSKVPVHIVTFSYKPQKEDEKASMSWHLTQREKKDIVLAYQREENQKSLKTMKKLLRVK